MLAIFCLFYLFPIIEAHGIVISPTIRSFTSKPATYGSKHWRWQYNERNGVGKFEDGWNKKYFPCYNNYEYGYIHKWTPGQEIKVKFNITAAHEGTCFFYLYKHWKEGIREPNETLTSFPCAKTIGVHSASFTVPNANLIQDCQKAGDCFIQWFWKGTTKKEYNDQNYANCFDFVVNSGTGTDTGSNGYARRKCTGS
jgi:hypothetical protein